MCNPSSQQHSHSLGAFGLQVATLQAEAGRLQEALISQQNALQVAKAEHQIALASLQGSLTADHQAAMDSLAELCRREVAEQADAAAIQLQAAAATQAAALDTARKAALEQSLQHEAQVQDLQEQLTAVQMLFDNRYVYVGMDCRMPLHCSCQNNTCFRQVPQERGCGEDKGAEVRAGREDCTSSRIAEAGGGT